MTPDLDQTLSLKAQLKDQVTPSLRKIEQYTQTTSEALQKLVRAFEQAGAQTEGSTGAMANKVEANLDRLQKKIRETSGGFKEFGEEASQNSRKVGQALEDALYTEGASRRLDSLERDLGGLNRTFTAMASRQRGVSGKARVLQAISRDNINKKLIPAFQELHGTLDQYPDTLDKINQLEENRLRLLDDGGKSVGRVEQRLLGLKDAADQIKFGAQDALGIVAGGMFGAAGMQVQDQQRTVGQLAGAKAFNALPKQLEITTMKARTTMDVLEPFVTTSRELRSIPEEVFPQYVAGMVQIQKATGMAGEEIEMMRDRLMRLGAIKLPDYVEVMEGALWASQNSTASMSELTDVIQEASVHMLAFSEAQRKTFLDQSVAAAAAAKDMGTSASTFAELREAALSSDDIHARLAGYARNVGMKEHIDDILRSPQLLKELVRRIAEQYGPSLDMTTRGGRRVFGASIEQAGIGKELFLAAQQAGGRTTGEGTGGDYYEQMQKGAQKGVIDTTASKVRGILSERLEQAKGIGQSGLIVAGEKLVRGAATVVDKFNDYLEKAIDFYQRLDRRLGGKLSSGIALGVGAQASWTLLRGIAKGAGALGLPVPKFMAAGNPISGAASALGLGPGGGIGSFIKRVLVIGAGAFVAKKGYDFIQDRKAEKYLTPKKLDELIAINKKQLAEMPTDKDPWSSGSRARKAYLIEQMSKRRDTMLKPAEPPMRAAAKDFLKSYFGPFNEMKAAFGSFKNFFKYEAKELATFTLATATLIYQAIDKVRAVYEVADYLITGTKLWLDNAQQKVGEWVAKITEAFNAMLDFIIAKVEKVFKFFGIELPKEKKEPTHKNLENVRAVVEANYKPAPTAREARREMTEKMKEVLRLRNLSPAELLEEANRQPSVEQVPGADKGTPIPWHEGMTKGEHLLNTMMGGAGVPEPIDPSTPEDFYVPEEASRAPVAATRVEIPEMSAITQVGIQQKGLLESVVGLLSKIVDNTSPLSGAASLTQGTTPGVVRNWDYVTAEAGG